MTGYFYIIVFKAWNHRCGAGVRHRDQLQEDETELFLKAEIVDKLYIWVEKKTEFITHLQEKLSKKAEIPPQGEPKSTQTSFSQELQRHWLDFYQVFIRDFFSCL